MINNIPTRTLPPLRTVIAQPGERLYAAGRRYRCETGYTGALVITDPRRARQRSPA
jgi:hypothetical protein